MVLGADAAVGDEDGDGGDSDVAAYMAGESGGRGPL
jgi:hypothetical protein